MEHLHGFTGAPMAGAGLELAAAGFVGVHM